MRFTDFIWDFDGTLADSYPRMTRAYQSVLAELGVDADYADVLARIKRSAGQSASHFSAQIGMDRDELLRRMLMRERAAVGGMDPYPGVCAALRAITNGGGRNFLYTHRDAGSIEAMKAWGVIDCFTDFITSEDRFPSKPAPDAILHLIEKHAIDPARAVMVGDRDCDIEAGLNAGIAGFLFDPDGFYDHYDTALRAKDYATFCALIEIAGSV